MLLEFGVILWLMIKLRVLKHSIHTLKNSFELQDLMSSNIIFCHSPKTVGLGGCWLAFVHDCCKHTNGLDADTVNVLLDTKVVATHQVNNQSGPIADLEE